MEGRGEREVAVADLKTVYHDVRREKMKRFLTGLIGVFAAVAAEAAA